MDSRKEEMLQKSSKEIYDSIIIPPELDNVVKKTIFSKDKDTIDDQYRYSHSIVSDVMKYVGTAAAAAVVCIIIGLNSSQAFAKEMGEVPVIGTVAKILTVRDYDIKPKQVEKEEISESLPSPPVTEPVKEEVPNPPETQVQEENPQDQLTVSGNEPAEETPPVDTVSGNEAEKEPGRVTISGNEVVDGNGVPLPKPEETVTGNDITE